MRCQVDAENAFGAFVREVWLVSVYRHGETWRLCAIGAEDNLLIVEPEQYDAAP